MRGVLSYARAFKYIVIKPQNHKALPCMESFTVCLKDLKHLFEVRTPERYDRYQTLADEY
jgi:hypothetical protein